MANMFDENGNYSKTEWKPGDRITAGKLNKIEESLEAINNNDIERHKEADERLDALEEQKEAVEERFDELEDLVADNKTEVEVLIYENNVKMDRLEQEMNDGIDTVEAIAHTVDDKIAEADASMKAQVNQGKADMEAMVAEVEADLEGLHAKDEELSEQLEHNTNRCSIKKFKDYTTEINIDGEIKMDWSNAIIEGLKHTKNLFFPQGEYYVSSTIMLLDPYINLVGEGKYSTVIKYVGVDTLFKTDLITSTPYLKFEGISFNGYNKLNNFFNGRLYNSVISNCSFQYFDKAFEISGVYVKFKDCEILTNEKGVSLRALQKEEGVSISTCFAYDNVNFTYNTNYAITTTEDENTNVIIKLLINNCGFEYNGISINIPNTIDSSISNSWFESNTEKAKLVSQGWILENNVYNLGDGIEFIERSGMPWGSGGHTYIKPGSIETKEVLLQTHYNSTRLPTTQKKIKADRTPYSEDVIKFDDTNTLIYAPNNSILHQRYYLAIEATGEVKTHNLPEEPTVTKSSTGVYEINFGRKMGEYAMFNIQALNATQGTTFVRSVCNFGYSDASTYNVYMSISKVSVKIYDEYDQLTDGRIFITVLTSALTQ